MAIQLVRYLPPVDPEFAQPRWGVVFDQRIAPLSGAFPTTGQLIRYGREQARHLTAVHANLRLQDVTVLSPITRNQQFICQGLNYADHGRESGMDPADYPFNTLFNKASSSLTGPFNDVVRPAHVHLLDYEIELGLVLGRDIDGPQEIRADRLHEVLAGVTIVNDISARDVQLPQTQFYKGKSYRTFGPTGPYLLLLEPHEWAHWPRLRMTLMVNGEIRQDAYCGDMLHGPNRTLTELSGLQDLFAGDLIATGTPAGCAATAPGKAAMFFAHHLLSDRSKWRLYIKQGIRNDRFLKPSDLLEACIRTDDGELDLGMQRNRVVADDDLKTMPQSLNPARASRAA